VLGIWCESLKNGALSVAVASWLASSSVKTVAVMKNKTNNNNHYPSAIAWLSPRSQTPFSKLGGGEKEGLVPCLMLTRRKGILGMQFVRHGLNG